MQSTAIVNVQPIGLEASNTDPTDYTPVDAPSAADLAAYLMMLAEAGEPGQDLDEPTPLEALDDGPRYAWHVIDAEDSRGGYVVIDRQTREIVGWRPYLSEAQALADDLVAEDHPDLGDWWNWMGPDADLEARWSLTFAGGGMRLDPDEDSERFA